ncbi:hypothetical protein KSC_026960 [Ktedonobacter sp. SOSP1-52]|uniref:hypothetical protein n=1 Tax=Ktedonobacter sp. SOSP1-52 TaxID=2778366 RepID=UPI0019164F9A|nr:hypothetical protein [Ktedonobacter sp. SOSP1-52]GHO63804.1 hypothetical protein KSC_026960 [Ktedonobacter sp. SOSP1-52]
MLAYVFCHWHVPDIEAATYQHDLIAYHRTLAMHKPSGFHHTRVLQTEQASWLQRNEVTYEDWHLVENSAALDLLNERAVSGPCQEPHRQIARWTQGSAGGLYQLVWGNPDLSIVRFAYRFDKPVGMTYGTFYEILQPLSQEVKGMLWGRQMNLGPGPEFCIQTSEPFIFPETLPMLSIPVKQICFTIDR